MSKDAGYPLPLSLMSQNLFRGMIGQKSELSSFLGKHHECMIAEFVIFIVYEPQAIEWLASTYLCRPACSILVAM